MFDEYQSEDRLRREKKPVKIMIIGDGLSNGEKQGLLNALKELDDKAQLEVLDNMGDLVHEREGIYHIQAPPKDTQTFQCFDKRSRRRGQRRRDKRWHK